MEDVPCHQVCYEMITGDEYNEDEEILYVIKVKPVESVELKGANNGVVERRSHLETIEEQIEQQAVLVGIPRSSFSFEDDWRYPMRSTTMRTTENNSSRNAIHNFNLSNIHEEV